MSKSKDIGTKAETGVVNALRRLGFPTARRLPLHGAADCGDVEVAPGVVAEVKGGAAAKTAGLAQLDLWWLDTVAESANYRATYGGNGIPVLVVATRNYGPERADYWRAFVPTYVVSMAAQAGVLPDWTPPWPVELTLARAAECLRRIGYGSADV